MSDSIEIFYGQSVFNVRVEYSNRKTLGIAVMPDRSVVATAPKGSAIGEIREKLENRARWIKSQVKYFEQFQPRTPAPQYLEGETHLYLGRQYRLRFIEDTENEGIKLRGKFFWLSAKDRAPERAKRLMLDWYKDKAHGIFARRLDECMRKFPRFPRPELEIKAFEKRWGGMSTDNRLALNSNLVRAPIECIDYVIIHEMCHIELPHHGPKFWSLLGQKMPGWERSKHRLEVMLA